MRNDTKKRLVRLGNLMRETNRLVLHRADVIVCCIDTALDLNLPMDDDDRHAVRMYRIKRHQLERLERIKSDIIYNEVIEDYYKEKKNVL